MLYILRSGSLAMQATVELEEINKCPVGINSWELQKTKRKVSYELRRIEVNEIFGHQELIEQ